MTEALTGGCQCGAIRFAVEKPGGSGMCHCRMCQKAFGSFYAAMVTAPGLKWTRGEPKWFQSSNLVRRGFCPDCGTPIAYDAGEALEIAVAVFDDPEKVAPTMQVNSNDKLSFVDDLHNLPTRPAAESPEFFASLVSYQHPDHDTEGWVPHNVQEQGKTHE